MESATAAVRAPAAADWVLAHGISACTTSDLAHLLGTPPDQVRRRLHSPMRRGEWVTPARGLWIPVPPEYRTWGAPPGIEIIDSMMDHLGVNYYIGWLTAAALHGAAHQAPQVFQVAVDRQVRNRVVGRTRFEFAQRTIDRVPTVTHATRSGRVPLSSIETTILDVSSDPNMAGGIDNAATVIVELAENDGFSAHALAELAPLFPAAAIRRAGYVLEHFSEVNDLSLLTNPVHAGPGTPSRLDPSADLIGPIDHIWMVRQNRDLEPDL